MRDPREWFNRRKKNEHAAHEAEVSQFIDRYDSRSMIDTGDGVVMEPGQVMENVHHLMERMELDPAIGFAPEEAIKAEESEPLAQMGLWDLIVTETAWSARSILAPRWPRERVEGPIAEAARLDMFIDGPGFTLQPGDEERAKAVLNRALASEERVDHHPELDGLAQDRLAQTWFPMLAWFGIKCGALHAENGR